MENKEKVETNVGNQLSEKDIEDVLVYEVDLAERILDKEIKREESILQQASRMQTAFSFVTATVFMALPMIVENKGKLSLEFLLLAASVITLFLLTSLVLATFAQNRWKVKDYPSIDENTKYIETNYEVFLTNKQRRRYLIKLFGEIQGSYQKNNKKKSNILLASFVFFYISLAFCLIFFMIGLFILFR